MEAIFEVYYQANVKIIYLEDILLEAGIGLKTNEELSLVSGGRPLKDTFLSWHKRGESYPLRTFLLA